MVFVARVIVIKKLGIEKNGPATHFKMKERIHAHQRAYQIQS